MLNRGIFFFAVIFLGVKCAFGQVTEKPNIIIIMFDDLNDWVTGFNGHPQSSTPNIAKIADFGTTFLNAFCSAPVCAPSRTSWLTGKNPHYTGIYNNEEFNDHDFRSNFPADKFIVTLPQYLKDSGGYYTISMNKIFHADSFYPDYDDVTSDNCAKMLSWNKAIYKPNGNALLEAGEIANEDIEKFEWSKIDSLLIYEMQDYAITDSAINFINQYQDDQNEFCNKPFFLALGYHRPHQELFIPEQYFLNDYVTDFYKIPFDIPFNYPENSFPYNGVVLAPQPILPYSDIDQLGYMSNKLAPPGIHNELLAWGEDLYPLPVINDTLTDEERKLILFKSKMANAVMAYLAAIKFADDQLGRFWNALELNPDILNNTIIIIASDNGYALDEKTHWKKRGLWETDIRIPFIIADMRNPTNINSSIPISLLDIFPTLCDFANIEPPLNGEGNSYLDGISSKKIYSDTSLIYERPVLTIFKDALGLEASCFEQYSVRNDRFHYIEYHSNNLPPALDCDPSKTIMEKELYEIGIDKKTDPNEWNNIADDSTYYSVINYLQQWLPGHIFENKKTYKILIETAELDCALTASDSIVLKFNLYSDEGLLIEPPADNIYLWTNNLTRDTLFGIETCFKISSINQDLLESKNQILFTIQMIDTLSHAINALDIKTIILKEDSTPSIKFEVQQLYNTNTVALSNITMNGNYSDLLWDFGDGSTYSGANPPEHTYNSSGTYTITASCYYGSQNICVAQFKQVCVLTTNTLFPANLLLVYPNPAQNNLFIHTQNLVEDGEILIYSISGEKVKAVSLANNQTLNISLSISELTQGLYFIVFKTGIYCYPGQFIKTI